jgi:hypothetical protein
LEAELAEELFWDSTENYTIGSTKKYIYNRKTTNSEFGVVHDIYGYQKNLNIFSKSIKIT